MPKMSLDDLFHLLYLNMLKRALDVFVSATALVVLFPALLVIAAAIQVCDGRPLFYRGIRIGRNGIPFRIFKFRTMVLDAEQLGGSATADTDVRITRIGRVLRKHKLDELPQLINVLLGEMSLVGPRPEVPEYVALLSQAEQLILTVRPGITDWATLWDADEGALLTLASEPERMYVDLIRPEKIKLQMQYVCNQSFWTDAVILWKTAYAVIFRPTPPSFALLRSGRLMAQETVADGHSFRKGEPPEKGKPYVSTRT
jgi:lipopolysaccharide/colanic/teichoic acid biosynthesis glycosyltransferase